MKQSSLEIVVLLLLLSSFYCVVVVVVCGGLKFCNIWLVTYVLVEQFESTNETGVCCLDYLGSDL